MAADCWVCTGKDCSRSKGHDELVVDASKAGAVELVRCQKIRSGPVFGTVVNGRIEWFEKVRGGKSRRPRSGWPSTAVRCPTDSHAVGCASGPGASEPEQTRWCPTRAP